MENLEKLLEKNKYKNYHFIEVMNCKGGCVGGGGQPLNPIPKMDEVKSKRAEGLYEIDNNKNIRTAHDNEELKILYKEFLKHPASKNSLDTDFYKLNFELFLNNQVGQV